MGAVWRKGCRAALLLIAIPPGVEMRSRTETMRRSFGFLLLLLPVILLAACSRNHPPLPAGATRGQRDPEFDRLAEAVVEAEFRFDPVGGTLLGFHDHDDELPRYSVEAVKARVAELDDFLEGVTAFSPEDLSAERWADREILRQRLTYQLWELTERRVAEQDVIRYTYAPFLAIARMTEMAQGAQREAVFRKIVARLRQIPRLVDQGAFNLHDLTKVQILFAVDSIDGAITFLKQELPSIVPRKLRREFLEAVVPAISALERFLSFFESQFEYGGAEREPRLGALPFQQLLARAYEIDYSIERLTEIATTEMKRLDGEILALSRKIDAVRDPRTILREVGLGRFTEYPNPAILAAFYRSDFEACRRFLADLSPPQIELPPAHPIEVGVAPSVMKGMIKLGRAIQYFPPLSQETPGFVYFARIDLTQNEERLRRAFGRHNEERRDVFAVRSAYPGLHLQAVVQRSLASPVRRSARSEIFTFGWAGYAENLMARAGFLSERARLWMLF
ncbi:MAG: DUF885 family protein, partial [Deltaproteobacteria bacterium]